MDDWDDQFAMSESEREYLKITLKEKDRQKSALTDVDSLMRRTREFTQHGSNPVGDTCQNATTHVLKPDH